MTELEEETSQAEGRLQRKAGSKGFRITRFREVIVRHGLFVFGLSLICLLLPGTLESLRWGTEKFVGNPFSYFIAGAGIGAFIIVVSALAERSLDRRQFTWVFYLLGISLFEEWIFRLALPGFFASYFDWLPAVILSNVLFGLMHYFTLRWRVHWCIGAALGGMGLNNLMVYGDLMLLVGIHWLATFLNTPHPPLYKFKHA